MDYKSFIEGSKTLLIAPAGYGKTHTIVECLKHTNGKQLILTHTHAGIASIKDKIRQANIASSTYNIETISSFAQKYVHAFYLEDDIPDQENGKEYHAFIIAKSAHIFSTNTVKKILQASYTGVFVDEYQDCTKSQHKIVLIISNYLPVHILGDPLQGIFDFNGDAVDLDVDLKDFHRFPDLSVPQRWYQNENNTGLGDALKNIRGLLLNRQPITLISDKEIGLYVVNVKDGDILQSESSYRQNLNRLLINETNHPDLESLLIIVPEYKELNSKNAIIFKGDINHRAKLRSQIDYRKSLTLLEAIDDKLFYSIAKKADEIILEIKKARKPIKKIKNEILDRIFNSTGLQIWFNDDTLKTKKKPSDQAQSNKVHSKFEKFVQNPSPGLLRELILEIKSSLKIKYKRDEIFRSFLNALKQSHLEAVSVYTAMKNNRNLIRRSGRKIHGKCLGTTLLTKGLEFDTVVIMDAHKFDCPKHFYVALTRCCKKLIIFTASKTLNPYRLIVDE